MKEKIKEIIYSCLEDLYTKDLALIVNDVSERAITHKLAEYLQTRFPEHHVDCEYNRDYERGKGEPKYLNMIREQAPYKKREIRADNFDTLIEVSTYPDIIVHRRLTNKKNLIVIEVKKNNSSVTEDFDLIKLRAFTSKNDENNYKYRFGVFIKLSIKNPSSKPVIKWFQDGSEKKDF